MIRQISKIRRIKGTGMYRILYDKEEMIRQISKIRRIKGTGKEKNKEI